MKKYKSLFFCSGHPTKNAGGFRDYFIENSENFTSFHFFPGYSNAPSYVEKYRNGKKVLEKEFTLYKGKNKILKNIFEFLCFSFVLLFLTERKSYIITNAPTYCFLHSFFSFVKKFKYVLWIGDYYPNRKFPMNLYHMLVAHYNVTLDYVLYLSPPVEKIYSKSRRRSGKFQKLITLGIKGDRSRPTKKIAGKVRAGFIGIIRNQQGLDLFFEYLAKTNDCQLDVMGEGYLLPYYKELARKLKLEKKVNFYGRVEDASSIFYKCNVGVALYEDKADNLSRYCEPTKIKDYLSYRLPVITTKTTYFANEIAKSKAGVVVEENIVSIQAAIEDLKRNYTTYLSGVDKLLLKYEYNKWYDEKFKFLEQNN